MILQTTPAARFGVSIRLNDSTFQLGSGSDATLLQVFFSDETFRFLQFNGIGYDLLSGYLVWTDVFVSDNKGNYLLPFWDASVFGAITLLPYFRGVNVVC